ncbi:putative calcium/sodium:proton antiporter [mine drainage metagenome]|uniref:Putative calcium/sodium:proton antiporter n=1 Tax=mine drainage metagenome TaxID=410659 RepID=A0A1J5S9E0_9ZZZZ
MIIWLKLLFCLAVIGYAGYFLSRYGDIIAEKTGMSASWVGLILLAAATSLPELVTGVSAVTVANAPDIAVGDVLGSTVFNLAILVLLDALYQRESLYSRAAQGHILSASLGALLIAFAGFSLLLDHAGISLMLWHVGLYSPTIVLVYFTAMLAVHRYEQRTLDEYTEASVERYPQITLRQAVTGYVLAATAVVLVGSWLPFVAKELSMLMGWEQSFVGTLLVAAVTSAPEAAVTISALRIGALDMAIANLLGSNLFDILILAADDLFYRKGSLLANVDNSHAITAFIAIMMSILVSIGFIFRPQRHALLRLTWISFGLFLLYILNAWILFQHGK